MRQSWLLGLLFVFPMIVGAQNNITNHGGMTVHFGFLPQSVTATSNASNKETVTTAIDITSVAIDNSSDNNDNNDHKIARVLAPCDPPTAVNVGSITAATASVSFTSAGTSFVVEYGPTGFTPGSGVNAGTNGTVVTGSASPIGLTGLAAGTTYQVYVRTNCGIDGYSVNTVAVSFATNCNIATIPYFENFDGATVPALPPCMTLQNVNADNAWETVITDNNVSSPNIIRLAWEDDLVTPANDWFFTKGLNLTAGTSYRLKFNYRNSDGDLYTEKLEVKYGSVANAASMTAGTLYSNTQIDFDTWLEAGVDFTPSSTGVYYIGFHGFSDPDQAYLAIDDISVDVTPVCVPPTGVTITNLTPVSATVNFTSPGISFVIEYGLTGFTPGTGLAAGPLGTAILVPSSQLPYTLTGLATLATYDVYIRQVCNGTIYGPNTTAVTFTTPLPNDEAPGAITITVDAACSGNAFTNSGSTQSGSEKFASCSGTAGYHSVWYKFTAPAGGAVKISTDFSGAVLGDSRLAVFSATNVNDYNTFTILGCDDNNGVISATKSVLYLADLVPNNVYYIQVDGLNSSTAQGTFCLQVSSITSSMIAGPAACGNSQGFSGLNPSYNGWVSLVDNSGNLIANVKQTAGTATDISANVNVNTLTIRQDPVSLQYYLDRNYKIDAVGATNAVVQFFFLNTELTTLTGADADATLSNLKITRQSGATCTADFAAANGTNSEIAPTSSGTVNGVSWVTATTPGFSNFYLHSSKLAFSTKIFLNGAYNSGLGRHKDVTTAWNNVLNTYAKNQPYNTAAFGNYAGTESVASFATPTAGVTTDILDWVLLEVKNSSGGLVARRAAFVREDGQVVDLDGVSAVKFTGLVSGDYYMTIRHRNHLGVSTQNLLPLTAKSLGVAPLVGHDFDFTSTTDADIFGTAAAFKIVAAKNVMICGNANSNANVRYGGLTNDAGSILAYLLGVPNAVVTNVYSANDINIDGTVRYGGLNNDTGFMLSNALGVVPNSVVVEQKR
jgi:hypothetical protein